MSRVNPFFFDMALLEPIFEMIQTGIRVDKEKMEALHDESQAQWTQYQAHLDAVAGRQLNVNSSKQMKELLYDELGMRVRRNNKKPTANEDALRSIMAEAADKIDRLKTESAKLRWKRAFVISRLALNIRSERKKISSYLAIELDPDGRCRSTISVGGTETGRFSHSKTLWDTGLNIATVPRKIRKIFIADEGREFAQFDLNRGESWVYAHLSEDPELLRIHLNGLDFHAETAAEVSDIFGERVSVDWIVSNKEGDAYKLRYLAKKINHASAYRMGAYQGAATVNQEADDTGITVTVSQFKAAQEVWLEKYSNIPNFWWPQIERQLDLTRTLKTPYGRVRQFHDFWGEHLFKEGTAYVPQSTSVDYLNHGLLKVWNQYQKKGAWDLKILTQTHDSILIQYDPEHRDECLASVGEALTSTLRIRGREFSIPIEAEYGESWGNLRPYEL